MTFFITTWPGRIILIFGSVITLITVLGGVLGANRKRLASA